KPDVTRYGAGVSYQVRATYDPMLAHMLQFNLDLRRGQFAFGGKGFSPARLGREFSSSMRRAPLLDPPIESVLGPDMFAFAGDGSTQAVRLAASSGAFEHIQTVGRAGGSGVWLADVPARELGVHPGDTIALEYGSRRVDVRVAGIYRALASLPRAPYWQAWDSDIYPLCPNDCPVPTPFAI